MKIGEGDVELAAHGLHRPGAKLASTLVTFGSVKEPMALKWLSNMSTRLLRKSVAYRTFCPWLFWAIASPVKRRWPAAKLSMMRIAWVGSTAGFQPLMVPSMESKIRRAGADLPFSEITKFDVGL